MWAVLEPVVQRVATVAVLDVLLWVALQLVALELVVEVSMLVVVVGGGLRLMLAVHGWVG